MNQKRPPSPWLKNLIHSVIQPSWNCHFEEKKGLSLDLDFDQIGLGSEVEVGVEVGVGWSLGMESGDGSCA